METVTKKQARRFLLRKQGLLGGYRFRGKEGAYRYIRQAGCIQFDPIDVCGRNPELVLLARVAGFRKEMLSALLYRDRLLVDYFDKNLAIFPVEDWPAFRRTRLQFEGWDMSRDEIGAVEGAVLQALERQECVCSKDLPFAQKVRWPWGTARLSRAVLESLYFRGRLALHHKEGTLKYYARFEDCYPRELLDAPDPNGDDGAYFCWRVRRRIGAVGLLWNRPSDAWLGIDGLSSPLRSEAFRELERQGEILSVQVEGCRYPLYYLAQDAPFWMEPAGTERARTEFLAPLDCLLWDRSLIRELFGFDYKWEIYTPAAQRKYGYYVLPVLHGDGFAGRVEAVRNTVDGILEVKHFWREPGRRESKALKRSVAAAAKRLAVFNGCRELLLPPELQ